MTVYVCSAHCLQAHDLLQSQMSPLCEFQIKGADKSGQLQPFVAEEGGIRVFIKHVSIDFSCQ